MGQYGKQKEKLLLTTETNFLTNLIIMGNSEPSEHDINELHICDMPDRYFADEDCLDQKASLESEMEGWVVCEYPYYE